MRKVNLHTFANFPSQPAPHHTPHNAAQPPSWKHNEGTTDVSYELLRMLPVLRCVRAGGEDAQTKRRGQEDDGGVVEWWEEAGEKKEKG